MDTLQVAIQGLDQDERRDFRIFIERQRSRKNRKDLLLFEILREEIPQKPRAIASRLHTPVNMNAYHVQAFITLKMMDHDDSPSTNIAGMLAVAKHLLAKNKAEVAAKYLHKAAQLAESNDVFDQLDNILNLQIRYAQELKLDAHELIRRWNDHREKAELEERVNMAYCLIRQKLDDVKAGADEEDLQTLVTQSLNELQIDEKAISRPALMYTIVAMTRSAIISSKSYHLFEPYVIQSYEQVLSSGEFKRKDHSYELWFLYMISHALYRNRKFEKALFYLEKFRIAIDNYGGSFFNRFYPKYVMLKASLLSFTEENKSAILLLESSLKGSAIKMSMGDRLNMIINLTVYQFQGENYRQANRTLINIGHTDLWLEQKMGKEWRFKKNLIEIILQIELGNTEIALTRIKTAERYFKNFLGHAAYQRAAVFLRFIKVVIERPEEVTTPEFEKIVDGVIERLPGDKEDIQAMTFYCWLKSKMLKQPYYPTLIETITTFGKITI
jgi:hypothetical protein